MNKTLNPVTGKELNPEIKVVDYDGKTTMVSYMEDFLKKTGVYDNRVGHGVWRLNGMLKPDEWKAVRKYFKDYHQGWFKWGTARPDMVVKTLTKLRNNDVDRVVVRHKMSVEDVEWYVENHANLKDCVTGEWLLPRDGE